MTGGIVLERRNNQRSRRSSQSDRSRRTRDDQYTRPSDRGRSDSRYDDYGNYDDYSPRSGRSCGSRYDDRYDDQYNDSAYRSRSRRMEPSTDEVRVPGPRPRKHKKKKKRLSPVIPLFLAAVLIMVVYGAVKLMGPGNTPPAPPQPNPPDGSSSSEQVLEPLARRKRTYTFLLAATDVEGIRTDTMMVATYDVPKQKLGVVSIPRDTLTRRPEGKNPRLVYGPGSVEQRREDISKMLGIPIDYYVKVDIRGFIALVDELEGIDFYVPCDMEYGDPAQGLSISYTEGVHHLNGQQAMEVARFRKNNDGSGYSDVGRTQTQQKLLLALMDKIISWDSLTKINGFVEIFKEYVETDLSLTDMLYFAAQGSKLNTTEDVKMTTLEGRGDGIYNGTKYCYVLDEEKTLEAVNRLVNPFQRDLVLEEMDLVRPDRYMNE